MTLDHIKQATWTYAYQKQGDELRRLPWAFFQFPAASGENRTFVVPLSLGAPSPQVWTLQSKPYRQEAVFMDDRPFPHGGAVHYFTGF